MKASRRLAWVGLIVFTACLNANGFQSAEASAPSRLPPGFARLRQWLPPDSTTILAASDFTLSTDDELPILSGNALDCGRWLVCRDILAPDLHECIAPLAGRRVAWALRGGRNYETVSAFGSQRSEGCLVLQFAEPLGDAAREWTDLLRAQADELRTISGHEVFVFPTTIAMEPVYDVLPWQATYFVLLDAETVLCATSDAYLRELLDRHAEGADGVAIADESPAWRDVDWESPVWMVHLIEPAAEARVVDSVSWEISSAGARVIYRPAEGSLAAAQEKVENLWATEGLRDGATIDPPSNGTVSVRIDAKKTGAGSWFLESLALHTLEGAQDTPDTP